MKSAGFANGAKTKGVFHAQNCMAGSLESSFCSEYLCSLSSVYLCVKINGVIHAASPCKKPPVSCKGTPDSACVPFLNDFIIRQRKSHDREQRMGPLFCVHHHRAGSMWSNSYSRHMYRVGYLSSSWSLAMCRAWCCGCKQQDLLVVCVQVGQHSSGMQKKLHSKFNI